MDITLHPKLPSVFFAHLKKNLYKVILSQPYFLTDSPIEQPLCMLFEAFLRISIEDFLLLLTSLYTRGILKPNFLKPKS